MKKGRLFAEILISAVVILLISVTAFAVNETGNTSLPGVVPSGDLGSIDKSYQCLDSQVKNKTSSTLSLQEAIFATLALGGKTNLQDRIDADKSTSDSCWPKSGCTIKETAQVGLAYNRISKNNDNVLKWLLTKNSTSPDLNWYLEMDITNHVPAECKLKYDNSERTINILDNMQISGNPGSCFIISSSGYWLLFRESCYGKEIQISCNQDFITALLYEKKVGGGTTYVLPETHSAVALGTTNEKVSVQCFKNGGSCDYEGTLWATLTLYKSGKNVDQFIPYLIALADDYQKYFPSAFLYSLIGAEDQYSNIVQNQKQGRFWKMIGTPYNEFYDTSLAMLGLAKSSSNELESAKNYLLSIRTSSGCWNNNNIRDTAFLLYAGWPKAVAGGGGGSGSSLCEEIQGQSCEISSDCLGAGGTIRGNFACSGFNQCCSIKVQQQSCSAQNGQICSTTKECDGRTVPSSEGTCCLDVCVDKQSQNTCEVAGGICRSSCADNEEENNAETCNGGSNLCCVEKTSSSGGLSAWIIILIILIILVVLAIIFRHKLKIWWFTFKGKAKVSPVVRPGVPPVGTTFRAPQQPPYRPMASGYPTRAAPVRAPVRKPASVKDKEMEETLKKLREMSK